jgi:hypothetical protein
VAIVFSAVGANGLGPTVTDNLGEAGSRLSVARDHSPLASLSIEPTGAPSANTVTQLFGEVLPANTDVPFGSTNATSNGDFALRLSAVDVVLASVAQCPAFLWWVFVHEAMDPALATAIVQGADGASLNSSRTRTRRKDGEKQQNSH